MASTCWECDATTSRPVTVTIGMPTGHRPRVQLCPSCYRTHYLPLIVDLAVDVPHEAVPPAPGATPRTRCTRR